jgi:hypothetical protein
MTRKLLALLAALAATLGLTVMGGGNASALGGEWLGCQVGPGSNGTYSQLCRNNGPTLGGYEAEFKVQNETAPSTYSWSVPASYQSSIVYGCTSTSSSCAVSLSNSDQDLWVSVTLTQGGASSTLTSRARILQTCRSSEGWEYC